VPDRLEAACPDASVLITVITNEDEKEKIVELMN